MRASFSFRSSPMKACKPNTRSQREQATQEVVKEMWDDKKMVKL